MKPLYKNNCKACEYKGQCVVYTNFDNTEPKNLVIDLYFCHANRQYIFVTDQGAFTQLENAHSRICETKHY